MSVYDPGPDFTMGTYEYGAMHDGRVHAGVDFLAAEGTPIPVAASGTVVGLGFDPTYGNIAIVRHSAAEEPPYRYTLYAHMSATAAVSVGTEIPRGTTIGYVSSTGTGGNGVPHLHFELLHLDVTWESLWKTYSRWVEYWQGNGVPLMLDNPNGRVDPLDDLNWLGVDVYFPPRQPRRCRGGGRGMLAAAMY
ncbi:MAG: M23 family metallopeptidase [Myxococcales bacterium]|nr:M23 family metallopeptidase [Myxococcales bacterium]